MKHGFIASVIITVLVFTGCNNYFHDLIPPDDNAILSFKVPGQIEPSVIAGDSIYVTVGKDTDIHSLIPEIKISHKATLIPLTFDYIKAAFPSADIFKSFVGAYTADNLADYVFDLIKENKDSNIPAITIPINFSGPADFLVISGQGNIRRHTVYVTVDTGEPKLLSFTFAKYDNEELMSDSVSSINENAKTVTASVIYPTEMILSYALIPSFDIRGDSIEIDGNEIKSGKDIVQFDLRFGIQNKTITVWRDGLSLDYNLTVTFSEDPDSIRSITDFRFTTADNYGLAANAVASIVNTEDTGTITVQVIYTGAKPQTLTPRFVSPGTVSVARVIQTSGANSHDFSLPVEYYSVSRNGLYLRIYTVKVEFISLVNDSPRITSFRFNQNINHDLVQDTEAIISDGSIIIDAYYGSLSAPDMLIPEFTAGGIVTVSNSVQISGSSAQDFSRQVKYTVTNPQNPILKRDYWVQVRMTRDVSSDARITSFGFYRRDNDFQGDDIIAKVDQLTMKIIVFAPIDSGITSYRMYPRFEAVGQVSVDGIIQSSGLHSHVFNVPIIYTVTSANGRNSKTYTVEVRELLATIFVDSNAWGYNDGTSWHNAFRSLKDACDAATLFPEDDPKEIWIAAGTYKPGVNSEDYFRLTPNTSYIGGFAGYETAKSQRNATNPVIISGDLGGGRYSYNFFGSFNGNYSQTVNGNLSFENIMFTDTNITGTGSFAERRNGAVICAVLSGTAEMRISGCSFNRIASQSPNGSYMSTVYVSGAGNVEINNINMQDIYCRGIYISGIRDISTITIKNSKFINTSGCIQIDSSGNIIVENIEQITRNSQNKFYSASLITINDPITQQAPRSNRSIRISDFKGDSNIKLSDNAERFIYINSARDVEIIGGIDNIPTLVEGITVSNTRDINISNINFNNVREIWGNNDNFSGIFLNTHGGCLYLSSETAVISNVVFTNTALPPNGGYNSYTGEGGAIYFGGQSLSIINCKFENCTVPNNGGAIYVFGNNLTITESQFKNCTVDNYGGAVYYRNAQNYGFINITDSRFENCTAGDSGGAIYINKSGNATSFPNIINSQFKNCTANYGGAIYSLNDNASNMLQLINSLFENCTTPFYYGGGAIYTAYGYISLNTEFINCSP